MQKGIEKNIPSDLLKCRFKQVQYTILGEVTGEVTQMNEVSIKYIFLNFALVSKFEFVIGFYAFSHVPNDFYYLILQYTFNITSWEAYYEKFSNFLHF